MSEKTAAVIKIEGRAVPLRGNDIDTDRIIPARFLRCVTFEGLGEQVFFDERFAESGESKDHPFNEKKFKGGSILFVNSNFGCGSSREHAPQALMRFGIRAIIGESFAEIFAGNCTSLGIPAMIGNGELVQKLQAQAEEHPDTVFTLDLESCRLTYGAESIGLEMSDSSRNSLLQGNWDSLDVLLQNVNLIEEVYERLPYMDF